MYKLSPSDFAYLYEECKCCYYLKVRHGIQRPQSPFPGVFSALNAQIQGTLIGKNLQELSPLLPEGIVESQEKFVESKLIPDTNLYIKGKYDLLVKQSDGTYMIIDLKITFPEEEKNIKYQTQLQAYHYAFEYPIKSEPKNVSRLGLLILYPNQATLENQKAVLYFPPKWLEIDMKRENFLNFIYKVNKLIEGSIPEENPDCPWCQYRHYGEQYAHLFKNR